MREVLSLVHPSQNFHERRMVAARSSHQEDATARICRKKSIRCDGRATRDALESPTEVAYGAVLNSGSSKNAARASAAVSWMSKIL